MFCHFYLVNLVHSISVRSKYFTNTLHNRKTLRDNTDHVFPQHPYHARLEFVRGSHLGSPPLPGKINLKRVTTFLCRTWTGHTSPLFPRDRTRTGTKHVRNTREYFVFCTFTPHVNGKGTGTGMGLALIGGNGSGPVPGSCVVWTVLHNVPKRSR